jgi:tetratricopeptide (TPR) repeat protein
VSQIGWLSCRFGDSAQAMERALAHVARTDDRRLGAEICVRLSEALGGSPMPTERVLSRCEQMLDAVKGDRLNEAELLGEIALMEAYRGNIAKARLLAEQLQRRCEELRLRLRLALAKDLRANIEMLGGSPTAAERTWRDSCAILAEIGERGFLSTRAAELAEKALYARGNYDDAMRFSQLGEETAASDDVESQARWRGARAKVLARRGNRDDAEQLGRQAVELVEATDYAELRGDVLMDIAEVHRLAGHAEQAAWFAAEALERYENKRIRPSARQARALLHELRAAGS